MKYVIERTYLLPVFQHLTVEADNLEDACRKAIDDDDWESAEEDIDGAGDITISRVVEVPPGVDPEAFGLKQCLYSSGLKPLIGDL